MRRQSSKKKYRELERESFQARLIMEKDAQREIAARLHAVEILIKNQGRLH